MAAEKHDPEFTLTILDKISLNQFAYVHRNTTHYSQTFYILHSKECYYI